MSTTEQRRRWRHLSLLQIAGTLAVVAFHIGIPYSHSGWIAVELFFVIAGLNMAWELEREQSIYSYALARVKRFSPELLVVWCATAVFVASGYGTPGMLWFIFTSPVFQQNLTLEFFEYTFPRDIVFAPLWYVGALLQLQVLLFALRKVLLRARPEIIVFASIGFGMLFRFLVAALFGQSRGGLGAAEADVLYCLPLTHLEAIVLGLLMGRRALHGIGRFVLLFVALAVGLGTVNVLLSNGEISPRSLGFEFPLRLNYIHVWGYTVLAFAASSFCSLTGPLATALQAAKLPRWVDNALVQFSSVTYGVYAFHGIIMATGVNAAFLLKRPHAPVLELILFSITVLQAFFFAWILNLIKQAFRESRDRMPEVCD